MEIAITELDSAAIETRLEALCQILADTVAAGGAVSFMSPLPYHDAARFWLKDVQPEVAAGRRLLFGATHAGDFLGTVQLLTAMPPNQPHRCEIAKMMVQMPMDGDYEYGSMTLSVDGEEVLGMFVRRDWTKEWANWQFSGVESLKVGSWIDGFMAFYNRLRSIKENKSEDRNDDYVRKNAAKIDLGNAQ